MYSHILEYGSGSTPPLKAMRLIDPWLEHISASASASEHAFLAHDDSDNNNNKSSRDRERSSSNIAQHCSKSSLTETSRRRALIVQEAQPTNGENRDKGHQQETNIPAVSPPLSASEATWLGGRP